MDLVFSANKIHFLQKIYHEIRHQEQTADAVIPDSFPDAALIADCFATSYLRSKEYQSNAVVVTGAVKAGVLYTPEDGTYPRLLEYYLPITFQFETPELSENANILSAMRICSVDARIVNSRKILLRVNIGCETKVFQSVSEHTHQLTSSDERLQCKKNSLTLKMPVEIGEKNLTVNEMLELPGDHPPMVELYKVSPTVYLSDRKLIGNKAVFKGELNLKIMYRSENDKVYLWKQAIPFSQFCELGDEYDEEEIILTPCLASCDVTLDKGTVESVLQIRAELLMQCTVYSDILLDLIEDAYCVRGKLIPQWASYALEARLDHCPGTVSVHQSLQGAADEIIDTEVYTDFPVWKRTSESTQMSVPVLIKVSAYTQDGALVSFRGRTEFQKEYQVAENASCEMELRSIEDINTHHSGSNVDVHCNFAITSYFTSVQNMISLCGGCIDEQSTHETKTPSVVLIKAPSGSPLWDIGKKYGTSVSSLMQANHLDENRTTGGMLLIPID